MAVTMSECESCGFPITAEYIGQEVTCPFCSTINKAISSITINTTLFWSTIAFIAGVVVGPYLKNKAAKYVT